MPASLVSPGCPYSEEEGGEGAVRPGGGEPCPTCVPAACLSPVASSALLPATWGLGPVTPTPCLLPACIRWALPPGVAPRHGPGPEHAFPACLRAPLMGAGGWGQRAGLSEGLPGPGLRWGAARASGRWK